MNHEVMDVAADPQTDISDIVRSGTSLKTLFAQNLLDPVDLRILTGFSLGLTHARMIARAERTLSDREAADLAQLIERRKKGEPVAYIVGEKEFYGLPFHVSSDVLVPRPETELLVELALGNLPVNAHMLDLGTGSGAIAIAVSSNRPDVFVSATDISAAALAIAEKNARQLLKTDARAFFYQGNWFDALPEPVRFDVIVSNPPYVARGDVHLARGDLRFEPQIALSDQADGLRFLSAIIAGAPDWLKPGGSLFLEHGHDQARSVRDLLRGSRFESVQSWKDLAAIERVSGGVLSG